MVAYNINTRLKEQTAMLTLVNLQKAFSGLSKPLVAPARRLVKKGQSRGLVWMGHLSSTVGIR
jgi:hypothetical protein